MSRLFTRILTTTAIISTVSISAFASGPMLKKADTNKDGLIQLSEFTAHADQKFSTMDADGNGLVTKEERQANRKQKRSDRAMEHFAKADSNGDGSISEEEFMVARAARAEKMKQKRDMKSEGKAHKKAHKKMHKKMKAHKAEHAGKRPKVDTNGDGAVDLAEHQAAVLARFERMDKDSDGVLSADEQKTAKGKRGKHKKHHGKKQHGMRQ